MIDFIVRIRETHILHIFLNNINKKIYVCLKKEILLLEAGL
jgi:hypothetical protein